MFRKFAAATAALALVSSPVLAVQSPVEIQREAAPVSDTNELGGNPLAGESTLYFLLGIAAVVAAIVLLSEDDDPISV